MKPNIILSVLFLFSTNLIFSQEKIVQLRESETLTINNIENGKIENKLYSCYRFGWKIKIPENYTVIDNTKLSELELKGRNELAKIRDTMKLQNRIHLIGFGSDRQNSFTSSLMPLDLKNKITLEEHKKFFVESLNQALSAIKNARFECETSDIKTGKYPFYKVKVKGYNSGNNQLVLTQIYYNTFIDGHLFSALITSNNDMQIQMLENNFLNSMQN
jgi:hypothetical protein